MNLKMFKYENLLLLLSLLLSFTSLSASIAARPLGKLIAATATPPTDYTNEYGLLAF